MDSLKFHLSPPCPTHLPPAGERPAAIFYPLGYPTPYRPVELNDLSIFPMMIQLSRHRRETITSPPAGFTLHEELKSVTCRECRPVFMSHQIMSVHVTSRHVIIALLQNEDTSALTQGVVRWLLSRSGGKNHGNHCAGKN
jgi:uncharacterized protein YwbE